MAVNIVKLKKQAVDAGMDREKAKSAVREVLEKYLKKHGGGNSTKDKPAAKKATAAAKKKKDTAVKKTRASKKSAPVAKKSTSASKKTAGQGKTKRPTPKASSNGDVGRAHIDVSKMDFKNYDEDAWKPRANSAVARLFKALRKNKGNVDKAFEELKDDVWDFVGKKMRDGTKRPLKGTAQSGHGMLKYRLNRTLFEFATRTGQHSVATNRIKYGTGDYAKAKKKSTKVAKKADKPKAAKSEKKAAKKRGRPKGSKNKKKS